MLLSSVQQLFMGGKKIVCAPGARQRLCDPLLDRGRVASQEIGRRRAGTAEEMASGSFSRSFPAHCALGSASYPARSARARLPRTSNHLARTSTHLLRKAARKPYLPTATTVEIDGSSRRHGRGRKAAPRSPTRRRRQQHPAHRPRVASAKGFETSKLLNETRIMF